MKHRFKQLVVPAFLAGDGEHHFAENAPEFVLQKALE